MKLVLAEKPSVAQSIAKVLGAAKREDGYLEGNGYVVSWCVGHLVELAQPEVYDAKYSKWAYADLPIFPMDWQYEVSAGTKKQFGILKKLMAREDVASLVCATDAGREGELIFRLVYHKAGCRKPFERLWISSMEDVAIKEGFENLRSGTEYDALYEAALCRERADWIVGINATRLFSTLYGQTLNVGRVMTPTLAMAVMREAAISAFKPELFYTVQIGLDGFTAASERFKTKAAAEAVKQSCSVAIVQKAECKEKTEKPPALYDLTSLQREANRVLGYTAQQTLDYTQNLYEKKLVTYPRTDSRFLTEDMAHMPEPEIMGDEAAWKVGKDRILAVQTCEDGYDYTLLDENYNEIDGGQVDNPELSMLEVRRDILESFGLERRELRAMFYEDVMEQAFEVGRQAVVVNDPIAELAFKLDRFAENFDPYEYMDQVDDVQAHIQEIKAEMAAWRKLHDQADGENTKIIGSQTGQAPCR